MKSRTAEASVASTTTAHPTLERSELWTQLTNAISLRASQDQVLWSIFGTFWAANAILLVALFTTGTLPASPIVSIIITSVGTILSLTWYVMQNRALQHLMRHEELMARIETRLGVDPDYAVSATVNRRDYARFVTKGPPARRVMPACSLGAAILWLVVLISFFLNSVL